MLYADTSRRGRPFAKDPAIVRFGGGYLLYYSLPPFGDGRAGDGWAIGIARSSDLDAWEKIGETCRSRWLSRKKIVWAAGRPQCG